MEVAINKLNALINEVQAQRKKKLSDSQPDSLMKAAQKIIDVIIFTENVDKEKSIK